MQMNVVVLFKHWDKLNKFNVSGSAILLDPLIDYQHSGPTSHKSNQRENQQNFQ
jgi:hypothetical protein